MTVNAASPRSSAHNEIRSLARVGEARLLLSALPRLRPANSDPTLLRGLADRRLFWHNGGMRPLDQAPYRRYCPERGGSLIQQSRALKQLTHTADGR